MAKLFGAFKIACSIVRFPDSIDLAICNGMYNELWLTSSHAHASTFLPNF
jgi:hypothetical protein